MGLFQKNGRGGARTFTMCIRTVQGGADYRHWGQPSATIANLELAEVDAVLIGSPDHWHKDHAVDFHECRQGCTGEAMPFARRAPTIVERPGPPARSSDRVTAAPGEIYLEPLGSCEIGSDRKISH
jgi:hypothetical protein